MLQLWFSGVTFTVYTSSAPDDISYIYNRIWFLIIYGQILAEIFISIIYVFDQSLCRCLM